MPLPAYENDAQTILYSGGRMASAGELEAALHDILFYLRVKTGHDLSFYNRATVLRRIARRMQINSIEDLGGYLALLLTKADEPQSLFQDLLISITSFFRDREAFQALERQIPGLFEDKTSSDSVRVWIPACATGEEAYSIAMLLIEHADRLDSPPQIQVFGCDLNEEAIRVARSGMYPAGISADVSDDRLQRFFSKESGGYVVRRQLRERVLFATHNLLKDPPFSCIDLVSCRNLLVNMSPDAQMRSLRAFSYSLKLRGVLFLGSSELVSDKSSLFFAIDRIHRIFAKLPVGDQLPPTGGLPNGQTGERVLAESVAHHKLSLDSTEPAAERALAGLNRASVVDLHYKLIERFAAPSVLINADYDVLHLSESAGRYLTLGSGETTRNLLTLVNESLRENLRFVLIQASDSNAPAECLDVPVRIDGKTRRIDIRASPSRERGAGYLLVVFFERPDAPPSPALNTEPHDEPVERDLARELSDVRTQLHYALEQREDSTEKLKSINEELHWANGKLAAVNLELKAKLDELALAHSDLQNLMASTSIATVFLDQDFRIKLYTPSAAQIFHIIPADVGHPFAHLNYALDYPELLADAKKVLGTLVPIEHAASAGPHWYIVRMQPYRTLDNSVAGVVLTLIDVTEVKLAQDEVLRLNTDLERRVADRTCELEVAGRQLLKQIQERERAEAATRASRDQLATILDTAAEGIVTLNESGEILSYNLAAESMFGYSAAEILGQSVVQMLQIPSWQVLTTYLRKGNSAQPVARREVIGRRRNGENFPIELAISETQAGERAILIAVMRDVSDRRELERQILEIAAEEQRRIGQDLHDSLGQELTGLGLVADSLVGCFDKSIPVRRELASKIATGIHQLLKQVRDLSHGLAPVEIDAAGLMTALKELAVRSAEQSGVECTFRCDQTVLVENNTKATHLFLIAREAVTNALKHGRPTRIDIRLKSDDQNVVLEIRNDGVGMSESSPQSGVGLHIMRRRAGLLNARLDIMPADGSPAGDGVVVSCTMPNRTDLE